MREPPLASVIIDNYNYGRYLTRAIDSVLNQTYPNVEVIVVDDGSTDCSRDIIAAYGRRITPVLKENGGMASTYNAGFKVCNGEVIFFLDSDDLLLSTAVEEALKLFDGPDVAKVHWPLWEIDESGQRTGSVVPHQSLAEGDLRDIIIRQGPDGYLSPPTSGNAWSLRLLDRILPMPEEEFRQHADTYLVTLAPVFGLVRTVSTPQGCYRIHGSNDYACKPADEKNKRNLLIYDHRCFALSKYLRDEGIILDPEVWRGPDSPYGWIKKLYVAGEELKSLIEEGETFILVDDNQWGDGRGGSNLLTGRQNIPFLERGGQYWGPPADDPTAIRELERLRRAGAGLIVFGWPSFWWLDHYAGLREHLRSNYPCLLSNDRLLVFDLQR